MEQELRISQRAKQYPASGIRKRRQLLVFIQEP